MKKITFDEFEDFVWADPAWASHLTEDVEIIGFGDIYQSKITHLSKHLHFKEIEDRDVYGGGLARFVECGDLKVATGNFYGPVSFAFSGVKEIRDLNVLEDFPASFEGCDKLKIATGSYHGSVDFSSSGVKEIKDLDARSACFAHCKKLNVATGIFGSHVSFYNSGIKSIENLNVNNGSASFENCKGLKIATGKYGEFVDFSESGVEAIKDLYINLPKGQKKADFRGCKNLRLDSVPYAGYVFRGKSNLQKWKDKVDAGLKKLQLLRAKLLLGYRELGITLVNHCNLVDDYDVRVYAGDEEDVDPLDSIEFFVKLVGIIYPEWGGWQDMNLILNWDVVTDQLKFNVEWLVDGHHGEYYQDTRSALSTPLHLGSGLYINN